MHLKLYFETQSSYVCFLGSKELEATRRASESYPPWQCPAIFDPPFGCDLRFRTTPSCRDRKADELGPSIKDSAKIAKNCPPTPLVRKISTLVQPPLPSSVQTHDKFKKIRSFLHQKVRTTEHPHLKILTPFSTLDKPSLLWTSPKEKSGHVPMSVLEIKDKNAKSASPKRFRCFLCCPASEPLQLFYFWHLV